MSGQASNAGGIGIGKWLAAGAVVIVVVGVLVYTGTQSQVAAVRTADVKYMAANHGDHDGACRQPLADADTTGVIGCLT